MKNLTFKVKGMLLDVSPSAVTTEFAYEIRNMRISATENNSFLSLTNLKGTKDLNIEIEGTPIGQAVIDNKLIIFCAEGDLGQYIPDIIILDSDVIDIEDSINNIVVKELSLSNDTNYIHKITLDNNGNYDKQTLTGLLGFNIKYPIETVVFYENEDLLKVYWTDGLNLPRFISTDRIVNGNITESKLNFIPDIQSGNTEQVTVEPQDDNDGLFPAGTIQYVLSYVNYYGQLSNIFYISPIFYNTAIDNGLNVDKTSTTSYSITCDKCNDSYEYVRIYSILRTSVDSIPETKVVADLKIEKESINYRDKGNSGYTVDFSDLLFIGGELLIFNTMTLKDNTLFIGNIQRNLEIFPEELKKELLDKNSNIKITFERNPDYKKFEHDYSKNKVYYLNSFDLKDKSSSDITTFKYGDYYRFGVLFLHKSGKWTNPIYLKDVLNTLPPVLGSEYFKEKVNINLPIVKISIPQNLITKIKSAGYINIRPVVVYPEFLDRSVICQGYVNPTVYNVEDRLNNSPFVLSSWFARPNWPYDINKLDLLDREINLNSVIDIIVGIVNSRHFYMKSYEEVYGSKLEFRHNCIIGGKYSRHLELLNGLKDYTDYNDATKDLFFVDASIVTLHSPEIEFDATVHNVDLSKFKFRIIGIVPLTGFYGDIDLITSKGTLPLPTGSTITSLGFNKRLSNSKNISRHGFKSLCSGVFYRDFYNYTKSINLLWEIPLFNSDYTNYEKTVKVALSDDFRGTMGFHIFPFQCSGDINPGYDDVNKQPYKGVYNTLQFKRLSNLKYSSVPCYFSDDYLNPLYIKTIGNYDIKPFYSQEDTVVSLKTNNNNSFYKGNIDKIITPRYTTSEGKIEVGTHRYMCANIGTNQEGEDGVGYSNPSYYKNLTLEESNLILPAIQNDGGILNDSILMRYKSTPHIIVSLKKYLPTLHDDNSDTNTEGSNHAINAFLNLDSINYNFKGTTLSGGNRSYPNHKTFYGPEFGWLWLAELYRDIDINTIFGGTSEEAITANKWIPCGLSLSLNITKSTELICTEGDTYFLRYDNLKTYPWSLEEENGITEVVSFMVETRINLLGRYDINKGSLTNFHVFPDNFNLINKAYTLLNNLFTYQSDNYNKINITKYPNIVSWSKTKTSGELVDLWINLNLSSTLELDGSKGKINALRNYNGNILAFLDLAIELILYNEQTQILPLIGVPIEISNSGKVSGKRTLSNQIGCTNKFSICDTTNGFYFIDSLNKGIYTISEGIVSLSDSLGFSSYMKKQKNLDSINTYYDKINKEVLFVNKDNNETLVYSEFLKTFTAFYDIKFPIFANLKDLKVVVNDNKLWGYQQGYYNNYYGKYKPYSITLLANPQNSLESTYLTLEFRTEDWLLTMSLDEITADDTFNNIKVWNYYQEGELLLQYSKHPSSNLRRKFRLWTTSIPRDNKNFLNKIRSPWTYIKLSREYRGTPTLKTELHDLILYYT